MVDCLNCITCPFTDVQEKEIIYEIHITVDHNENFVDHCYSFGIKPVIIDMGENIPSHAMTSSTVRGNDDSAMAAAIGIADLFKSKGYSIKRIKIETVPFHPKASNKDDNQYFETHFAILYPFDAKRLKLWANNLNLHYSRNSLKQGTALVQMLTFRSYESKTKYEQDVANIKNLLTQDGFVLDKVINEFALYDTNTALDQQWLTSQNQK